jgi:hypothetical protein
MKNKNTQSVFFLVAIICIVAGTILSLRAKEKHELEQKRFIKAKSQPGASYRY